MAQFSLMALVLAALVMKERWPEFFWTLRGNFLWILLVYVALTAAARLLERRRRREIEREIEGEDP